MHKLIIFSALIVCALASWAPTNAHQQHPQGSHQAIASHDAAAAHAEHGVRVPRGRDGQLESVHHGGGTVFPNKEFRRIKKGRHDKHIDGTKGRNHLRRVHSRKHYRH